jgi:hypothetical protein
LDATKRQVQPQISKEVVFRYIDRYAANHYAPPLIARFLSTHWRAYLLQTYVRKSDESRAWRQAVDTMSDLVWSVRPKTYEASRRRLYMMLIGLYQRLHDGLERLRIEASEQDLFFAELAKLHQAALYPPLSRSEASWRTGTQRSSADRSERARQSGTSTR